MKKRQNIFAVTGHPILHSKSPYMFNEVFFRYPQIYGPGYGYTRLAASSAEEAIYLFRQLDLAGMNVTAPFKQDIMEYLDTVEPSAMKIGGVNTVIVRDGGLIGANTDYSGVVESLKRRSIPVEDREFIVLGAGGAGRAAAYGLVRAGARVIIVNRTYAKAAEAAALTGGRAEDMSTLETLLKTADGLVSTLPADTDVVDQSWLRKELVVFDADYKRSRLSHKAHLRGCDVIYGEEWLLNQAIPAFTHFLGSPPTQAMKDTMELALENALPNEFRNIALIGFMGAGKTHIGKMLADVLGFQFKDTDAMIEAREGCSIARIFEEKGEDYFRELEKEILSEELANDSHALYSCGGGMVLDEGNKRLLQENALVIWLYSSIDVTLPRLDVGTRPLLNIRNPKEAAKTLLDVRLIHYARTADLVVSSEADAQDVVRKIYDEIRNAFDY